MRLLPLLLACCLSTGLHAHNPLTAKFELDATHPGLTVLHVYTSQTGLHQALLARYPATDFTTIATDAYKQLAVEYLRGHIHLEADGMVLPPAEGGIKLGSHQTDFKFLLPGYPQAVQTIWVRIDAFAENEHHQSVFWWKHPAGSEKVVFRESNEYTGTLSLINDAALTTQLAATPMLGWLAFGLGSLALGALLIANIPGQLK